MKGRVGEGERAVFDPGLQPERTALAWRRTNLASTAAALVSLRVVPAALGAWSLALCLVGLLLSVMTWALAGRRARRVDRALASCPGTLPGGGLLLVQAALVAGGGAVALVVLLALARRLP